MCVGTLFSKPKINMPSIPPPPKPPPPIPEVTPPPPQSKEDLAARRKGKRIFKNPLLGGIGKSSGAAKGGGVGLPSINSG
jgi:hypothetical protein